MGEMTRLPVSLWSDASGEDMSLGFSLANSPLLNDVWSLCSVLREYRLVNDSPRKSKTKSNQLRLKLSNTALRKKRRLAKPYSLVPLTKPSFELVIGRSSVRLLRGALGLFSEYACVTYWIIYIILIYSPGLKYSITFIPSRICHRWHSNPSSMQDFCPMNLAPTSLL